MSGGERIVAFFQRLGVPNADSLNPEDLDWMLESGNKDGTLNGESLRQISI